MSFCRSGDEVFAFIAATSSSADFYGGGDSPASRNTRSTSFAVSQNLALLRISSSRGPMAGTSPSSFASRRHPTVPVNRKTVVLGDFPGRQFIEQQQ